MTALLKSQENIAAQDNGDMADDTVKIPQLGLPLKVLVVKIGKKSDFGRRDLK